MSYHLNVRGLAGLHLGQHVTVKTRHTEASGVLQGFRHDTDTINDSGFGGESWALGQTHTTITLLPDQRIVATMGDEVVVHGATGPEPEPRGWQVGDTAQYLGEFGGKHLYVGGAAHQAEMNGENNGPVD